MITVDHSTTINRDPAEVFAYATDPSKNTEWDEDLIESKMISDGPMEVGSVVTDKRKFLGRDMDSEMEVTKYGASKIFAVKTKSGPVPFEITYSFSPADGGTKVDIHAEGEPAGFFKLAGGAMAKELEKSLKKTTAKMKEILES